MQSGLPPFDRLIQGLRPGDNVVWQVDRLADYRFFAAHFVDQSLRDGRECVYLRFAPDEPVVPAVLGLEVVTLDPGAGFDNFSARVQRIIEEKGREACYVFDNLSALVAQWATDVLLANFFQITCPFLYQVDAVAYFALTRGRHAHSAVARIRDTTQLLLDVYHVGAQLYVHPLKVWDRYSPQMFLPHRVEGEVWSPIFQSGEAAELSSVALQHPLQETDASIAPWQSVYQRLLDYSRADEVPPEMETEVAALRRELTRMMLGAHPKFDRLVDRCLGSRDLLAVRSRLIGSGRIGGKAAGILAARCALRTTLGEAEFNRIFESQDSFYVGSDVFFTFLVNNNLFRLRLNLSRSFQITHEEFEEVQARFLAGSFPPEILKQFRAMLDYYGEAPIIVRSSSFLEDSFGNAFAGKYRSEFLVNQGSPDERMEELLRAVKLVYASALNPDAITYRRRRGLDESDEQMAILVMRVSGLRYGKYFFPTLAGVAFSRNLYAWNDRIDPRKGLIRLVFGLGTHAVDRAAGDYPRMIAVSHPQLRPEVGEKIAKYSQRVMDVLDLEENRLVTLPAADLLDPGDYPGLHFLVSVLEDGQLYDPVSNRVDAPGHRMFLTFNKLIARTDFVGLLGGMLEVLEEAYGEPVDTEFTAHLDASGRVKIDLLQCRPLRLPGVSGPLSIPGGIEPERVLFRAARFISGGEVPGIRHILYIDPRRYAGVEDLALKRSIGRLVGRINRHPEVGQGKLMMMGPGRWGSNTVDLGVNVGYADIDRAAVLVELAREEAGHLPEVSYGTHFFQDLVEQEIIYLPVYPDDEEAAFNAGFFDESPNALLRLFPSAEEFAGVVKLIDVPEASGGASARVVADPETRRAVCFLE
ncbi:MAG: PEP/pyruvate-binding domain-containing protein [Deferrisomatales bacterium]